MTLLVLDPGHGGTTPAGRSTPLGDRGPDGAREKDVTLRLSRRVADHLGDGVRLTRDGDVNRSLADRVATARQTGARAFVSLHANAGSGSAVYVHPNADAGSRALARALARATGPAYGGDVREAAMAVLSPQHHAPGTAACMIEVDCLAGRCGAADLEPIARSVADALRGFFRGPRHGAPSISAGQYYDRYTNFVLDGETTAYLPLAYYSKTGAPATAALLAGVAGTAISSEAIRRISLGRPRPEHVREVVEFLHANWATLVSGAQRHRFADVAAPGASAEQLAAAESEPSVAQSLWIRKHLTIDCNGFAGNWLHANGAALRTGETDFSQTAPLDLLINTPAARRRAAIADVEPGDLIVYLNASHVAVIDRVELVDATAHITQVQSWDVGKTTEYSGLARGPATLTYGGPSKEARWSQSYLPADKRDTPSGLRFPWFNLTPSGLGDCYVAVVSIA